MEYVRFIAQRPVKPDLYLWEVQIKTGLVPVKVKQTQESSIRVVETYLQLKGGQQYIIHWGKCEFPNDTVLYN